MSVGLSEPSMVLAVNGVQLASIASGIKTNGNDDLVLIYFDAGSSCAATFTKNAFCAAPVMVARTHLQQSPPRAFLINSGNANAGTGKQGLNDAHQCCDWLADNLSCRSVEVLPFSTGVIGEVLPMEKLHTGIIPLIEQLAVDNWLVAAHGIMTTDTIAKVVSAQLKIGGETIILTGMAKGSGMIKPDMATMLCFIATDATVAPEILQQYLSRAVENSFNAITVDGDTSTNDACMLVATGKTAIQVDDASDPHGYFFQALEKVCITLAQAIIRDGEGATKFVTIDIEQANSKQEAKIVAYTIAHSPLVKTALFASDPNWGRILAAVGRSGLPDFNIAEVNIFLGEVCIVRTGGRDDQYTEERGQRVMNQAEITIRVELGRGDERATIWTTDLSHDYVTINAEYRT